MKKVITLVVINEVTPIGIKGGVYAALSDGKRDVNKFSIAFFPESGFTAIHNNRKGLIFNALAIGDKCLDLFPGQLVSRFNAMIVRIANP